MATYLAGDLLSRLMERAIRTGQDVEVVRSRFMADNSDANGFNSSKPIEVGGSTTIDQLADLYAKGTPVPTTDTRPTPAPAATRSSTTVSVSQYSPGTIDRVAGEVASFQDHGRQLMAAIQGTTKDFVKAAREGETAAKGYGDAKAVSIQAAGDKDVQRNDFINSMLSAMGIDITDPSSAARQEIDTIAQARAEMRPLEQQLTELRKVSFAQNPLNWVVAQFKIQGLADQFNSASSRHNNAVAALGDAQRLATAQLSVQPGVASSTIAVQAAAEAQAAVREATVKSTQLANQARSAELASMGNELQIRGMVVDQAFRLAQLEKEKLTLTEAEGLQEKEKMDLAAINRFRAMGGADPISGSMFKVMPAGEKQKMIEAATRPNAIVNFGDSPGDAIGTLTDFRWISGFRSKLGTQGQAFFDRFVGEASDKAELAVRTGQAKKFEDAFRQELNKRYKGWREELNAREYDRLSPDNPYKMNAFVFAQAPALKNNRIAQFVLAAPAGSAQFAERDLIQYAISLAKTGEDPVKLGQELEDFFRYGYKAQVDEYKLGSLGFDLKSPKYEWEYPLSGKLFSPLRGVLDPGATFTGPIQGMNAANLTNVIIKQRIAQEHGDKVLRATGEVLNNAAGMR